MRASESDRAVVCPHSLVVARTLVRTRKANESAGYGHLVHSWKETGRAFDPESGDDWSNGDADLLRRKLFAVGDLLDRGALWPGDRSNHELTFAVHLTADPPQVSWYHRETATCTADEWKAAFGTEFLTGTLDYVGTRDGTPWVDDLKTGRWPVDPARSRQLRSYALAVWASRGCAPEFVCHVSITQWPVYPLDGLPVRTWHVLDTMDLEEHLEDLRYSLAHPEEAVPSDQCAFCDGRVGFPTSAWMQNTWYRAAWGCEKVLAGVAR